MDQPLERNAAALASVIANCWLDKAFQSELVADPRKIFTEFNIGLPDGCDIQVVVDGPKLIHMVLADCPLRRECCIDRLPAPPTLPQAYAFVYEKARHDYGFRRQFLAKPNAVLRALGLDLAADVRIVPCETTAERRYFAVPAPPPVPPGTAVESEIAMLAAGEVYIGRAGIKSLTVQPEGRDA
jgi:hypothetical protein